VGTFDAIKTRYRRVSETLYSQHRLQAAAPLPVGGGRLEEVCVSGHGQHTPSTLERLFLQVDHFCGWQPDLPLRGGVTVSKVSLSLRDL